MQTGDARAARVYASVLATVATRIQEDQLRDFAELPPPLPHVPSQQPALLPAPQAPPAGSAAPEAAPVSVPLLSSALAAALSGCLRIESPTSTAPAMEPAQGVVDSLCEQVVAQQAEQQRQLAYIQSMHQWASKTSASLRHLQQRSVAAASVASAAKEAAGSTQRVLPQLAGACNAQSRQIAVLEAEVAVLKEQLSQLAMHQDASVRGGATAENDDVGHKRRRIAARRVSSVGSGLVNHDAQPPSPHAGTKGGAPAARLRSVDMEGVSC